MSAGRAGIMLGLECSRLARNNTDWYQLLEICAMTDTLIGDADGVYHPPGQRPAGARHEGHISEAELHLLRSRLTEGLRSKAARGELRLNLPAGLDYDDGDQVIIAPDEAVAEAITTVFRRFSELGSARQVVVSLRADELLLPRRNLRTGKVVWAEAGYPAVHDILTHPAYAGIFSYGRTRTGKYLGSDGKVASRQRRLPRPEWRVMIPDHHPGYISMDTFEANIATLAANKPVPAGDGGGAARGKAGPVPGPDAVRPVRAAHAGQLPPRRPGLPLRARPADVRREDLPASRGAGWRSRCCRRSSPRSSPPP